MFFLLPPLMNCICKTGYNNDIIKSIEVAYDLGLPRFDTFLLLPQLFPLSSSSACVFSQLRIE